MPHARLTVAVTPLSEFGPHGADDVEIRLSAHPGAPALPLHKGASGGELSRVMLAIEVVFAGADPVPTFVFDEVDAGVGGKAAVEIGRRLARLARLAQVIVVTHLPQVAAFADTHLVVEKADDGSVTRSGVTRLDRAGRVRELSRMLAGLEDSEFGRAHAEELLAAAAAERAAGWPGRPGRALSQAEDLLTTADGNRTCSRPPRLGIWQTYCAMKAQPRKLRRMRRKGSEDLPGVTATARLDRRTKNLTKRLRPGDIAIIDHADLDLTGADALAGRQVAAVVNAAPSISGRYPNLGPQLLIEAGIPLIDDVGPEVFDRVQEGQLVRLDGDTLYAGDQVVAKGTAAGRRVGGGGDGRGQGQRGGRDRGVRDQHAGVHQARVPAADRRHRGSPDLRTKLDGRRRAGRAARLPPPRGPRRAALLHPGRSSRS